MPEQEQDILWGVCDLQMLNIPQYVTHICWGQQECGLSWVSWPILQKEDTGYHAWKCSSFLPGPRKKVLNAAVKNCRDSDVLQRQWQRARRKSIALDKVQREATFMDTHPVTSPATVVNCQGNGSHPLCVTISSSKEQVLNLFGITWCQPWIIIKVKESN